MHHDEISRRAFLGSTGGAMLAPAALGLSATAAAAPAGRGAPDALSPVHLIDGPIAAPQGVLTQYTIAEAEKLAGITFTDAQRRMLLQTIPQQVARFAQRHTVQLSNQAAPAQTFSPVLPGMDFSALQPAMRRSEPTPDLVPQSDEDIAFAPLWQLSRWIERGDLTSVRLTGIYLERLRALGPALECVVTLTDRLAERQAVRADREIAAGQYRGPLHGIPWGAKDLLDTAGIRTTWGAAPFADRVPDHDAAVVRRLEHAGAVLVAKLSLGALAYGDIWFDGRTNNPWNPQQGSSGSSAGSAAATAAGLVGFSIGTETLGSIVSPCMRCGATGLRPTFGRVPRSGAMALCWSLDKIGPICRTTEDCLLVLDAVNGSDDGDPSSVTMPLSFDAQRSVEGVRIGWNRAWFEGRGAMELDQAVLDHCRALGMHLIEIDLPDWPYDSLLNILYCEAAAAFEDLTRSGRDASLKWQSPRAWPNTFRQSWFIPGIELLQAERLRRRTMEMMAARFAQVDAIIGPSFAASLLLISNATGHPSLTVRTGFFDDADGVQAPYGITIIGRLFDEGTLASIGMALERRLDVWHRRPPGTGVVR